MYDVYLIFQQCFSKITYMVTILILMYFMFGCCTWQTVNILLVYGVESREILAHRWNTIVMLVFNTYKLRSVSLEIVFITTLIVYHLWLAWQLPVINMMETNTLNVAICWHRYQVILCTLAVALVTIIQPSVESKAEQCLGWCVCCDGVLGLLY